MENASKALIMAGGIFLAIALITFGVYTYSSLNKLAKSQDEKTEQQQLVDFNKSYEAYNKSIMYGTDLITVMNKANDNNEMYDNDEIYRITITFKLKEIGIYAYNQETRKRDKKNDLKFDVEYDNVNYTNFKNNDDMFDDFKRRLFKCTKVEYNKNTGRISNMDFEEVRLSNDEKNYLRK